MTRYSKPRLSRGLLLISGGLKVVEIFAPMWLCIFLIAWPFKLEWLPVIAQSDIRWDAAIFCEAASGCTTFGVVHLDPKMGRDKLETVWIHELHHSLQYRTRIQAECGGWLKFMATLGDLVNEIEYPNQHTEDAFRGLLDQSPWEAYAELPWILQGDIPESLECWYPWFDGLWYSRPGVNEGTALF